MRPLVAIVGPTAVGKSKLALYLAQALDGEIVSADSRQVYRYMDIGTAKPSLEERARVRHHLIDIVDPGQDFNVALYLDMAYPVLEEIEQRGKVALLVGGSGLYVKALVEGWQVPQVAPDPELRRCLEAKEPGALRRELQQIDPLAAERIDPRNLRRIIRAIEVYRRSGVPFSQFQTKKSPPFGVIVVGLTTERGDLYRRIDSRVDAMIEQGLVEEVRGLLNRGYGLSLPSMSSLGYKHIGIFLEGKLELTTAIQRIKYETHRFARHQYAWFRLKDETIHWYDVREDFEDRVRKLVEGFVPGCGQEAGE